MLVRKADCHPPLTTTSGTGQADLLAAEENTARLDARGYSEDDEEEAEATYTQGPPKLVLWQYMLLITV